MKTRISKSDVMKRAWSIYKSDCGSMYSDGYFYNFKNFSDCLKRSWVIEKANIEYNLQKIKEQRNAWTPKASYSFDMASLSDALTDYYANNRYNGD